MDFKDGDTITVNGKACRIEGGALVPVVNRGPLGGEVIEAKDLHIKQVAYFRAHRQTGLAVDGLHKAIKFEGVSGYIPIPGEAICETNIPPRPTFTPMTAGEAAKLPDIVGRWVAVPVTNTNNKNTLTLGSLEYARYFDGRYFDGDDQILLIEGVDLP